MRELYEEILSRNEEILKFLPKHAKAFDSIYVSIFKYVKLNRCFLRNKNFDEWIDNIARLVPDFYHNLKRFKQIQDMYIKELDRNLENCEQLCHVLDRFYESFTHKYPEIDTMMTSPHIKNIIQMKMHALETIEHLNSTTRLINKDMESVITSLKQIDAQAML